MQDTMKLKILTYLLVTFTAVTCTEGEYYHYFQKSTFTTIYDTACLSVCLFNFYSETIDRNGLKFYMGLCKDQAQRTKQLGVCRMNNRAYFSMVA